MDRDTSMRPDASPAERVMSIRDRHLYPTLARLLNEGKVWPEGTELVGRASDGEIVSIGSWHDVPGAEAFLAERPDPQQW